MASPRDLLSITVPMRISFAGGGTDVNPFMREFGGEVVSCSISKSVRVVASPNLSSDVEIADISNGSVITIKGHARDQDLPKTLTAGWLSLLPESARTGFKVIIESDAPPGSGLGASSSIAVATCQLAAILQDQKFQPQEIATDAYKLERFFLGLSGGCQDHYAAAYNGFNYYKFTDFDAAEVFSVDTNTSFIKYFIDNLTLVWTGVARDSATILNNQIVKSEKGVNLHALKLQKKLASDFHSALRLESFESLARLLSESWTIKKQFADSITNTVLDEMYSECMESGALGGKLLGAGGGGYFLFLSRPEMTEEFRKFLQQREFPFERVHLSSEAVN